MFLQASPREEEGGQAADFDDMHSVVRGMSRVQLAQETAVFNAESSEVADDAAGSDQLVFSAPSSTAASAPKSPFRSPGRRRGRRLRSILKKPNFGEGTTKSDKRVAFAGIPESNSPAQSDTSVPTSSLDRCEKELNSRPLRLP